jgi:DNA-binding Lrp family transcriptional regulator
VIVAIVLIQAEADTIPEAAQSIADIEGVTAVYSCAGDVDLIAMVRVGDHEILADLVPGRIGKVPGVLNTDTHIAFRSYSRSDTESTFGIGMEGAEA